MNISKGLKVFLGSVLLVLGVFIQGALAQEKLRVAAAANLLYPMKEIAQTFEQLHHVDVEVVFNSSGKLFALLEQGAPFDLFFSADAKRPDRLFKEGVCAQPVVYTHGVLVFWSLEKTLCQEGWPKALTNIRRLAIADPKLAPYGEKAVFVLKSWGLWPRVKDRLVKAFTVSQAFQWAESGNADAALISFSLALSGAGAKGCYLLIPKAPLIEQKACLIKNGHTSWAQKFLDYVLSPAGQKILAKYGYQ